jgi:prophage maintenance system killer protein
VAYAVALKLCGGIALHLIKVENLIKNAPSKGTIEIAAYYLKSLPLLQPFPDGNHRTALIAVEIFLKRNGHSFEYTGEEAEKLRNQMLDLQLKIYGTCEGLLETVTTEPGNEILFLCRDFIKDHAKRAGSKHHSKKAV